ncbi:anti-CBASS protein Acb1 family protein [Dyadobacter psychrotolerans]|uniref:DUF1073 domain-containing protein n=1 Tax=Dyadobacter psychrotolerans TaxID=2541721 RepID=A0A4R5DYT9_9BACT|nr:anti-CBASS Acb1 family protein [Dyadobacter psychrotolerans]TDE17700.1 DUF1073 domain-containing protein [Dyadobacter psychrotolerans]
MSDTSTLAVSDEFRNSLTDLTTNLGNDFRNKAQLSSPATFYYNTRQHLVSNNRGLLSWLYVELGIVQTLIDQPVDDAFRHGIEILCPQLDETDIATLQDYLRTSGAMAAVIQARKWARLFGGAGTLIITDQDPARPLTIERINENSPMQFRAVDMHELYGNYDPQEMTRYQLSTTTPFQYYGIQVDPSRVYVAKGKEAPAMVRGNLRGWGMSEVERLVRSLNQYLKYQDVVFELMDEAKVDVYKIQGFNQLLAMAGGTEKATIRLQAANMIKNYINALVMDSEDDHEQKTMSFTGLADMLPQIRMGIAADLKIPITKLFGVSAAGFSSGEDDIENYNSMIESEIRYKAHDEIISILKLCCQKLFGVVPDGLEIKWPSLRIMSAEEQEKIKDFQFNRIMKAQQMGVMSDIEAKKAINTAGLLPITIVETEVNYAAEREKDETIAQGDK